MVTRTLLIDNIKTHKELLKSLKKEYKKHSIQKISRKIVSCQNKIEKFQRELDRKIRYSAYSRNQMILSRMLSMAKTDPDVHNALIKVWSDCESTNPGLFVGVGKPKLKIN